MYPQPLKPYSFSLYKTSLPIALLWGPNYVARSCLKKPPLGVCLTLCILTLKGPDLPQLFHPVFLRP